MSPTSLTISTTQRLLKSSSRSNPATQMPSYLHDAELSDETIGKALSSPLFIQEREEPASRRQAYHSFEESLLPSQSLSVCYVRTGRPVHELSSLGSSIREKPSGEMEELQKSHVLKVEELSRRKSTEDFEEVTSIFQGSNVKTVYIFGDNDAKRSTQMLRLTTSTPGIRWLHHCTFRSEKQVRACCKFITHKEQACFHAHSQFSVSTGRPVIWMSQKRKSDQELDNCQFRLILERDREQLLAEAKSEISRHEYWADLAEKNICELKRQIDSQAVEIGHTRTGYEQSRREQALLHEELADRERALLDSRVRSIQKLEELKRDQEFRLEEFSVRKLVEHHFKDVECVRSGQLFHVTIQPALFLLPREPGGLLSRDSNLQRAWFSRKRFCKSTCVFFDNLFRNAQSLELIFLLREISLCK